MRTNIFSDQENAITAYSIALICSLFYIQLIYPLTFLAGQGKYFFQGDAAQHVSGWLFYKEDAWRFPLLYTNRLNSPEGISIVFTDSIPIAAIIFKLFSPYLPVSFNYIGGWHALVYITQALSATFFMRVLGVKSIFSVLISSLFALTWPTLAWRLGHTALSTHSIIIASLACYFWGKKNNTDSNTAFKALLSLILIALLIHPYLFMMCFVIFIAFLLDQYLSTGFIFLQLKRFFSTISIIFLFLYIFGFLGFSANSDGFGFYSMNLLAPFCGGYFIDCTLDATGGQGEGFQYFGLGFLLLLSLCILLILKQNIGQLAFLSKYFFFKNKVLLIMFFCLLVFSLSNKIYLGQSLIVNYPIPSFINKIANIFRSSGRFFWPISYTILFGVLAFFLQRKKVINIFLLIFALSIQWVDLSHMRKNTIAITNDTPSSPNKINQLTKLFSSVENVYIYPVAGCHSYGGHYYLDIQMAAALSFAKINTGYIARGKVNCQEKEKIFSLPLQANSLFIAPIDFIHKSFNIPNLFFKSVNNSFRCIEVYNLIACGLHETINKIATKIKIKPWNLITRESKQHLIFNAHSLPSNIGIIKKNFLSVKNNGSKGFLSFGPYINLSPGLYNFSLQYLSNSPSTKKIGSFDVFSTELSTGPINTFPIKGTSGQLQEISHMIRIAEHINKLEARTFYYGSDGLSIKQLSISKIN